MTQGYEMDMNNENKKMSNYMIRDTDVYDLLLKIPVGRVSTYSDLAKALGKPSSSRLVGRILGNNPNPVEVPCHRVVKSDGKLGGYMFGTSKKKDLLEKEGISIVNDNVVDNFKNIRFYYRDFNNNKRAKESDCVT
jgi:methylated-DNA-[protein]-cysteine S-methyltransferase